MALKVSVPAPSFRNMPLPPILPASWSVTSPSAETVMSFAVTSDGMLIVAASAIVAFALFMNAIAVPDAFVQAGSDVVHAESLAPGFQ